MKTDFAALSLAVMTGTVIAQNDPVDPNYEVTCDNVS